MRRLVIICPDYPPRTGGLADHTRWLAHHLSRRGSEVIVVTSRSGERAQEELTEDAVRIDAVVPGWGVRGIRPLLGAMARHAPEWVIVQYVPHLYGRGGINLVMPLVWLWQRRRGTRLLLILHELYQDFPSLWPGKKLSRAARVPRFPLADAIVSHRGILRRFGRGGPVFCKLLVAALAQRLMLRLSLAAACAVAVSTEAWTRKVRSIIGDRRLPVVHLPSPSSIVLSPIDRERARTTLGLAPEEIVLCFFGTCHVSKRWEWVLDSLATLLGDGKSARLLVIGPDSERLLARADRQLRAHILATGYLDAESVSHALQASDLFLVPTSDGVSTRRTTVMAALQHGLAVVATDGRLTDDVLRRSNALGLTPADDAAAFIAAVRYLAGDVSARCALGERGRQLYETQFAWPVIISRLLDILETCRG